MLRNLIDEEYLKGYAVKIGSLYYPGETNWSKQKSVATDYVFTDFAERGYDVRELMPELTLRASGNVISADATTLGIDDTIVRRRLVIDSIVNTLSGKVLTFKGSNDNTTWQTISTKTILITDTLVTVVFDSVYKYYQIVTTVTTGTIDYHAYLVERIYDNLFACQWLWWIYFDIKKSNDDQFGIKMESLERKYQELMNNAVRYIDSTGDGVPDEVQASNQILLTR